MRTLRLHRDLPVHELAADLRRAFSGIVSFVGLMMPHLVRMLVGGDYRRVLPLSALFGAIFLVLADIAARALTTSQIAALTTEAMVALFTSQIAALETADVAALSMDQVAALTTGQVVALGTGQVAAIGTDQIAAMTTAQVKAIETADLVKLTDAQLQVITTAAVAAMTQFKAMEHMQDSLRTAADFSALVVRN